MKNKKTMGKPPKAKSIYLMKNRKISAKLISSCLIISLVSVIIGVAGIFAIQQMKASSQELYEKETAPIPVISNVILNVNNMAGLARDYVLYGNQESQLNTLDVKAQQYLRDYNNGIAQYEPTVVDPKVKPFFQDAKNRFTTVVQPAFEKIVSAMKAGDSAKALQYMDSYKTANAQVTDYYTICMNRRINTAEANNTANSQLADRMTVLLMAILVLGALGSVGLGFWLARSLSKPINEMAVAARNLAQGNLDVDITYVSKDEIGSLANSLKSAASTLKLYVGDISANLGLMAQGDMTAEITQDYHGDFAPIKDAFFKITNELNETLSTINRTTEQVSSGAEQASGGAQALAQGATEQASSIQELSATIEEISESLRQNAMNVDTVTGYVENAVTGMQQGDEKMQQMLSAMEKINNSSNEIKKIIKVIEDIAFQTNILALNAAVEAARAGEAGKGFAVVADEVRNLAGKSASAAKQTTELIEGSIQDVENGSKIADLTAKLLSKTEEKVQLVGEKIGQIDQASSQQAIAINQITQGVEQISAVVQTNSATAEQSAASSEELSAQAEMLRNLITQFKLKNADFSQSDIHMDQIQQDVNSALKEAQTNFNTEEQPRHVSELKKLIAKLKLKRQ